ncbi:MAG: GTPase ObgE [Syntrophales bacterium]
MKFIDEARIYVKGGDGGRGCVSFRREKFVPRGGPDGGEGGKGGDVIVRASKDHHTLLDLKFNQHHVAGRGAHGSGNNRTGRSAPDLEIVVPAGTVIMDAESGELICDLAVNGQSCIVAKGGIGGKGNASFATATHRAPRFAQDGMKGEERWIRLELKLLADVGIVGMPNAGKSTLIGKVSAARPKVAEYPFTTLTPNLGVVVLAGSDPFVVADIPGLIGGAHAGAGLGIKFLRHIERTHILIHLIDVSGGAQSAWADFETINRELALFSAALEGKPQIVAFNKIDLAEDRKEIRKGIGFFRKKGMVVFAISARTGEGVDALMAEVARRLASEKEGRK